MPAPIKDQHWGEDVRSHPEFFYRSVFQKELMEASDAIPISQNLDVWQSPLSAQNWVANPANLIGEEIRQFSSSSLMFFLP